MERIPEYPGATATEGKSKGAQDVSAFQFEINRTRVGDSENVLEEDDDEETYERLQDGALFSTNEGEDRTHLSKHYNSNGRLKLRDTSSLNGSSKKDAPTSTVYSGGATRGNPKLSGLKFAGHRSGGHMRKHGSPSRVLGDFQMQIVNKAFADF